MKIQKVQNFFLVVFFLALISIPLLLVNTKSGKISSAENRVLANFPTIKEVGGGFNKNFLEEFEMWFNDNLGLRDEFVRSNTILQYNLFGKLTKTDTLVGSENWLYYVTPNILKDYQHLNLPTNQQLEDWGGALKTIDNYLKGSGIPFITMINLDKKTIYPEHYPKSILKVGGNSRTDILLDYLVNKVRLDVFTPEKSLLKAKETTTVYSPRYDNAHWNSYGAFLGYQDLMDRVKKYYPNIKTLSWEDFEIKPYEREFNLYNAIHFKETDLSFKLKKNSTAIEEKDKFANLNLIHGDLSVAYKNEDTKLPKLLILGDSYLYGYLTPYLAESFSEMNFIYTDNISRLKTFVDLYKPDIVLYENVERMLDNTLPLLKTSADSFLKYDGYLNLPVENDPSFWLDYTNGNFVENQKQIKVDSTKNITNLVGWALDTKSSSPATNVYLKVDDKYYSGEYGIPRQSVADAFSNNDLINSGFSINIDTKELLNAGEVSFIIISNNREYQYSPITMKIIKE